MLLSRLFKEYSYVILLMVVTFICGIIYINALIQPEYQGQTEEIESNHHVQYVMEYNEE